jgi:hypothetical protein
MFKYRCDVCGVSAYSSASYATVGTCPSCGSGLLEEAVARAPEPDPASMRQPRSAVSDRTTSLFERPSWPAGRR